MKKNILLLSLIMLPMMAVSAVKIDGIIYDLDFTEKTATVKSNNYSGTVVIPSEVIYNDVSYNVTSIGEYAFHNCSDLTSVTIPNSVMNIGNNAFYGCSGLTSITIPNSVTDIGSNAFTSCKGLTNVSIPNSVTSIAYATFKACSSLTKVTIGNSVAAIGNYAFDGCSGLTHITIPNSVTRIGDYAFYGCSSLVSVIIGKNLETLRPYSFGKCDNLKDVYCYAEKVPTASNAFSSIFITTLKNITLHVPESSIIDYKITSPWNSFGSIVGMSNSGDDDSLKCAKPTIYYSNGTLIFRSETKEAEFVSEITDADIKKYYDNEVLLTVTYNISVYATKSGYEDSEVATATLCWIDVEPKTEGISDGTTGAKQIEANAVLIQTENGQISVSGANDNTAISVFGTNGLQVGSAVSRSGQAVINTHLPSGSIAIVKIGNRSVKVAVK